MIASGVYFRHRGQRLFTSFSLLASKTPPLRRLQHDGLGCFRHGSNMMRYIKSQVAAMPPPLPADIAPMTHRHSDLDRLLAALCGPLAVSDRSLRCPVVAGSSRRLLAALGCSRALPGSACLLEMVFGRSWRLLRGRLRFWSCRLDVQQEY